MPAEPRTDATLVDTVLGALNRSGAATLEASQELLAHYGDAGDASTQRALDTLIDHAADALRALTDSFADISNDLETMTGMTTVPANAFRYAEAADGSSALRRTGATHRREQST